jgi:hypothetical protein
MASPGGMGNALAFHPTKKVNKVEELTYLSTNIKILKFSLKNGLVYS